MYRKLQINRKLVTSEQLEAAWRCHANGPQAKKYTAWRALYYGWDEGSRRKDYARILGVSPRTLERYVNEFNAGGFWASPAKRWATRTRKPIVDRDQFLAEILPRLERALAAAGTAVSLASLHRYGKAKGLFQYSYATFRRLVGERAKRYRPQTPVAVAARKWCEYLETGEGRDPFPDLLAELDKRERQVLRGAPSGYAGKKKKVDRPDAAPQPAKEVAPLDFEAYLDRHLSKSKHGASSASSSTGASTRPIGPSDQ